jgi:hypothetical protein
MSTHQRLRRGLAASLAVIAAALASLFLPAAGTSATAASADCTPTSSGGNVCVLNPSRDNALEVSGGSTLSVSRDLVVDSSSRQAANASGASRVTAATIGGPGGFVASGGATYSPTPVQEPAQPDPFAGVAEPAHSCSGGRTLDANGTTTASPGTYSTLRASGSGMLTLQPGVYSITQMFENSGTATISGSGVTIYLCNGASFHLSGGSTTNISAPGGASGFVIFADRASTAQIATDNVNATLTGRVYAKLAPLLVQRLTVNGDIVVDILNVHSGGTLSVGGGTTTTPTTEHPGIKIVKSERVGSSGDYVGGPISAHVGDGIDYRMVVSNTGDTSLTIAFSDPRCDSGTLAPAGTQTIAAGGSLAYTCSHLLVAGDGSSFTNTATATGTSPSGDHVGPVSSSVVVNVVAAGGANVVAAGGVLGAHVTITHKVAKHHVKAVHKRAKAAKAGVLGASFTG